MEDIDPTEFLDSISEEQKKEILSSGLMKSYEILNFTAFFIGAKNFIEGTAVFPNGERWHLKWEKLK